MKLYKSKTEKRIIKESLQQNKEETQEVAGQPQEVETQETKPQETENQAKETQEVETQEVENQAKETQEVETQEVEKEIEIPLVSLPLYEMIDNVQYYFGKTIPEHCEEVNTALLTPKQREVFLAVFKDRAMYDRNREFSKIIAKYLDSYIPQEELLSWDMQYEEAKAFSLDKTSKDLAKAYPLIANLCLARYGSLDSFETLAHKVLEKSSTYRILSGNLIGQKQKIIDNIEQSQSIEELLKALDLEIDTSMMG